MKKLITAVLLTAALIPATSFAGLYIGNELLANCESKDDRLFSICIGYISANSDVHDTFVNWGEMEPNFCIPKAVTIGQLEKVVVKNLNERPESLHRDAGGLVSNALTRAFPYSYKDDGTRYCPE